MKAPFLLPLLSSRRGPGGGLKNGWQTCPTPVEKSNKPQTRYPKYRRYESMVWRAAVSGSGHGKASADTKRV